MSVLKQHSVRVDALAADNMDCEMFFDMPQGTQRVKKALTLAERIDVIREYEKTPNTRYLARLFGCGRTQIQNILRHRQEYMDEWQNNGDPYRVRRRQSIQLVTLGAIVYEWIQRSKNCGVVVTDDLIRTTGQRVANLLNIADFRPSNRWLERLKTKYKLFDTELLGLDPTISGEGITKKSLKLEDIIEDLRDPYSENNFLIPPNQYHGKFVKKPSQSEKSIDVQNSNWNEIKSDCVYVLTDSGQSNTDEVPLFNVESAGNPEAYEGVNKRLATGISSYKEALNYLGPLEQFALMSEDIRAIGLINQLENLFRENMEGNKN